MSGMSHVGPWISLKSMDRLNATNTLYVIRFRELLSAEEKAAWAISLLSSDARLKLNLVGRAYPDGLVKFEPGDLAFIPLQVPRRTNGASRYYSKIVEALHSQSLTEATRLADEWLAE
jgi:hypothetical protein